MTETKRQRYLGVYTKVGGKKAQLNIGGSEKKIMEEDFFYEPSHGFAGHKDDMKNFYDEKYPEEGKKLLKNSYNKENISKSGKVRKAFDGEVERYKTSKVERDELLKRSYGIDLNILSEYRKKYEESKKSGTFNRNNRSTLRDKRKSDLKSKIKKAKEDSKVIDITNLNSKGEGSKRIAYDEEKSKKKRLAQDENELLYYVVYNSKSKNSIDGVKNFMKIFMPSGDIDNVIKTIGDGGEINLTGTRSPTRSTVELLSPSLRKRRNQEQDVDELIEA